MGIRHLARLRLLILALLLFSLPISFAAEVVVFDSYSTTATLEGDIIKIERDVRLKNVGKAPIIPGELHFRLFQSAGSGRKALAVESFSAVSGRGETLSTKVISKEDETDLSVQLWNPLLPGFHFDFTISYEVPFEPSGVFFYEINLPQEETTVPIINEQAQLLIEDKYKVTYAPGSSVNKVSGHTVIAWDDESPMRVVEYSRLPMPRVGVRAVNIFWSVIIVALLGFFLITVWRQRKGSPPSSGGGQQYHYPPQYQYNQQQQYYGGR